MKIRTLLPSLALLTLTATLAPAAEFVPRARTLVNIPDIPGYHTLKCDFHMHTVFSDGKVWPDQRSEEAWREGLDAIAITDHIEALRHTEDLRIDHNRAYEIAAEYGKNLDLIVIHGSEITRQMPPGHINAVFLEDSNPLDTSPHLPRSERHDWRDAVAAAHEQDAFIFYNHPGWIRQAPDGIGKWYDEHQELYENGMLHGIEVVNDHHYYPEAHQWCIDKNLTMLSNSDIHPAIHMQYAIQNGAHRPMTLVFAKERSADAIREALFERRTALYTTGRLIGDEQFLAPIFAKSVEMPAKAIKLEGRSWSYLQIHNTSDLPFELELVDAGDAAADLDLPESLTLYPGKTSLFAVRAGRDMEAGTSAQSPRYRVKNLLVRPNEGLEVEIPFRVEVVD